MYAGVAPHVSALAGSLIAELLVTGYTVLQHLADLGPQSMDVARAGGRLELAGMLLDLVRRVLEGLQPLRILVRHHEVRQVTDRLRIAGETLSCPGSSFKIRHRHLYQQVLQPVEVRDDNRH